MVESFLSSVIASAGVKFIQRHSLFRSDASSAIRLSLRVTPKSGSSAAYCRCPNATPARGRSGGGRAPNKVITGAGGPPARRRGGPLDDRVDPGLERHAVVGVGPFPGVGELHRQGTER